MPVWVRVRVEAEGLPPGIVEHVGEAGRSRVLQEEDAAGDLTAAVAFFFEPSGGLRVRVLGQPPVGSGLGGSSAYAVALARALLALQGRTMGGERLVPVLRDLEARVLGAPAGCQDHWAAERGGVLALHLEPGGERLEGLPVEAEWLASRMTVFYTGITHHSGMVNWQVIRRRFDREPDTTEALESIADAARRCRAELIEGSENGVGQAVADEWSARRRLAPEVCPPDLDTIIDTGLKAGALAIKACGAGGGGSILVWHSPGARGAIVAALAAAAPDGRVVATEVAKIGCRVLAD